MSTQKKLMWVTIKELAKQYQQQQNSVAKEIPR